MKTRRGGNARQGGGVRTGSLAGGPALTTRGQWAVTRGGGAGRRWQVARGRSHVAVGG